MRRNWPVMVAKSFAVLSMSAGVGLIAGAITYVNVGPQGRLYGGAFTHVADVVGWGTGFLTASMATFATIAMGRRGQAGKPPGTGSRDEI